MIETLKSWDRDLFFLINGNYDESLDNTMFLISGKAIWFPLYFLLILGVIWQYRKLSVIFIVAAFASVGASDFVTSGIMKPTFERFRPTHEKAIKDEVHTVNNYRGGKYGFASSHAANSFAIASFFFFLWRKKYYWIGLLFVWAFIISFSRIYLGVHYPGDIITGAIIGIFFGWLLYKAATKIIQKTNPEKDDSKYHNKQVDQFKVNS